MSKKMLIDASHPEETRVVIVDGNRVEELDFESRNKRQLRGNVYLARVTRVEPSLQAAFIEYGGNRHGFLAFSEIHPDYYQIPYEDRIKLLEAEEAEAAELAEEEEEAAEKAEKKSKAKKSKKTKAKSKAKQKDSDEIPDTDEETEVVAENDDAANDEAEETPKRIGRKKAPARKKAPTKKATKKTKASKDEAEANVDGEDETESEAEEKPKRAGRRKAPARKKAPSRKKAESGEKVDDDNKDTDEDKPKKKTSKRATPARARTKTKSKAPEDIDEDENLDELEVDVENTSSTDRDENLDPDENDAADEDDAEVAEEQTNVASKRRKRMSRRRYKIQEVIKRGQILLVQAVKEERGNKGAAMTTYLSLAGRYCVLMPNTPRGGGISRKIANGSDRKRLKTIMNDLEVPQGMGVIVRTAGAKRTKTEIKRDYDYLSRLWSDIRDNTLKSIAPALIHEEGNLVKRSIRDLYNKDIDEVLVEGDEAYKTAKGFIKMLMPSHAKFVKDYKDDIPLFLRYNVERQIEASLSSVVQLKSGGYLVIHPTEALVSVDVNSGRSTKERNVERTALRTNLEAAEELARQMRLRDLAGLIVVDFIDMDEHRNNRAVEKKMKEVLSRDRARIQTSRISQFGLMEISRQRRRRSLLEGSTAHCEHCSGVGRKRTIESSALAAIRAVEEIGVRRTAKRIRLKTSPDVALYLFNEKRNLLQHVEQNSDVFTEIQGNEDLIRPAYEIEIIEKRGKDETDPLDAIEKEFKRQRNKPKKSRKSDDKESDEITDITDFTNEEEGETKPSNRRSRRRRRGGRGRGRKDAQNNESANTDTDIADVAEKTEANQDKAPTSKRRKKAPASKKVRAKDTKTDTDDATKEGITETTSKETETPKSKRAGRRKAPARKPSIDETDNLEAKVPSKRTRKAPAKKAKTEEKVTKTSLEEKPAAKKTSRKKAPARKKAPIKKEAPTKATKEKETKKTAPKTTAKKSTTKPATKAKADKSEDKATKLSSRRKAPSRAKSDNSNNAESDAAKKKKKGWLKRLMSDD